MTGTQKQITIVAALIQNENGEILIAKRHQPDIPEIDGLWEFAGGGIEFGEDPIDAIKREVKEELGVEVEVIRQFPKIINDVQNYQESTLHVLVLTYECKIVSGTPKANLNEEIGEVKFVRPEEIKNFKTFNNIQQIANYILNS